MREKRNLNTTNSAGGMIALRERGRSPLEVQHKTVLRKFHEEEDCARDSSEGIETPERIALICARASGMASFTASESSSENSNDCAPMVIRKALEGTTP